MSERVSFEQFQKIKVKEEKVEKAEERKEKIKEMLISNTVAEPPAEEEKPIIRIAPFQDSYFRFIAQLSQVFDEMRSVNVNMHPVKGGTLQRWRDSVQSVIDGMRGAVPNDSVLELRKKRE